MIKKGIFGVSISAGIVNVLNSPDSLSLINMLLLVIIIGIVLAKKSPPDNM